MHPFVADPRSLLGTGAVAIAGDCVPGTAEADEAFAVDVEQIAGTWPLVPARLFARCLGRPRDPGPPQRPPDGRVRVAGLAGDQPRPPAAATPRRADPGVLARRQQARAAMPVFCGVAAHRSESMLATTHLALINVFTGDIQGGLGPFLGTWLAETGGWSPARAIRLSGAMAKARRC